MTDHDLDEGREDTFSASSKGGEWEEGHFKALQLALEIPISTI
jgi:hypothetical protein